MDFQESKMSLEPVSGPSPPSLVCVWAGVGAAVSVAMASSPDMLASGIGSSGGDHVFERFWRVGGLG